MQQLTLRSGSLLAVLSLLAVQPSSAQLVLTEGTNMTVDISAVDGGIAIDLLGRLWIVPPDGGDAVHVGSDITPAKNPRWSPDGRQILYQSLTPGQSDLRLLDVNTGGSKALLDTQYFDQHAAWHPGGARIVFSSERGDSGFDLWELDLASQLTWRLTSQAGDETDAAWSANGRHLAYIHRQAGHWSLKIRRFAQPDQTLFESADPMYAPSWRPDGSLLTWLQQTHDGLAVQMAILSDPPLVRPLLGHEDFFLAPLSWSDRQHFVYASDGAIKSREFDAWHSKRIRFTAVIDTLDRPASVQREPRRLEVVTPPTDRLVIRSGRMFDGIGNDYRYSMDVLVEAGRVVDVVPRKTWDDAVVLDLGETSLLPGLVDSYAALSNDDEGVLGAMLLSWGVTTIVSPDQPDFDPARWESEQSPGPRLLRAAPASTDPAAANVPALITLQAGIADVAGVRAWQSHGVPILAESWTSGLALGADLLIGADSLPVSPRGLRYQDMLSIAGAGPITLVSGLADISTPGLAELLDSPQALRSGRTPLAVRRFSGTPSMATRASSLLVGSLPNGLPPGLALHAELLALEAAGLDGDQVLRAAGANSAKALGLNGQFGVIEPGALADLVVVNGDPLDRAADAMNIVAVVRNGRFYSLGGLLERIPAESAVEKIDSFAVVGVDTRREE
jgi:hypothetical protein